MIEFKLYSLDNPKGLVLAKVVDQSTANVLKAHFKQTYAPGRFMVTVKQPRQKEQVITHFDGEFTKQYPHLLWGTVNRA